MICSHSYIIAKFDEKLMKDLVSMPLEAIRLPCYNSFSLLQAANYPVFFVANESGEYDTFKHVPTTFNWKSWQG